MTDTSDDRTLTIKTYTNSLKVDYTIENPTNGTVPPISGNITLTGVITEDTSKVENIFNTFLTGTSLKAEYAKFAPAQSLAKGVLLYRNFADLSEALKGLSEDELKYFNITALNSVVKYIKNRYVRATPKTYFTQEAIGLGNSLSTATLVGENLQTIAKGGNNPTIENDLKDPNFLQKYLQVNSWVTQFHKWLTEFMINKETKDKTIKTDIFKDASLFSGNDYNMSSLANTFGIGVSSKGGNKTQKNRNVYEE